MDTEKAHKFVFERSSAMILILLSEKDLSFNELKNSIKASPNTVLARLREAMQIGIVEEKLVKTGKRALIKYTLTKEGGDFVKNLKDFKGHFITVNKELDEIKEKEKKKEIEINELLSSLQKSSGINVISNSKLVSKGDMNITSSPISDKQIKTHKNQASKNIYLKKD